MPNDALVIDMFHMNKVEVDPEKKQATVQGKQQIFENTEMWLWGGAYLRDVTRSYKKSLANVFEVDKACAPHKLATTFGHYGVQVLSRFLENSCF